MLKFFRKIRRKLLAENKFSKYLIYAIGEIVLVVIGILIALSINNWNQERKDREKEKIILTEMVSELKSDRDHLKSKLKVSMTKEKSSGFLLNFIDENKTYDDSLTYFFSDVIIWTTFNPSVSSFETLNNGGFSIISDDSLKLEIQSLYNNSYSFIPEMDRWREKFHFHEVQPFESKNFKTVDWWDQSVPLDGGELLNNQEYYYILKMYNNLAKQEIRIYEQTISEIEDLKKLINRHLD